MAMYPLDGTSMPVDDDGNNPNNATGSGARTLNARQNRALMNSLQPCSAAIFAFGNDAAIRSCTKRL